ncbi:MAG: 1-hydroxycarotenoid 3,4-desaturase CrtD [Pseudomonadota bacterium]
MRTAPPSDAGHIVVIGAGIAGLMAALRLSVAGARVTLLERHDHLGGKIRTLPSAAGPINAGPTVLTMRHVFDDLFAAAGTRLEDHVRMIRHDVIARHAWPDGSRLDLYADHGASRDAVAQCAGSRAARQFDHFCTRARTLFEAFEAPMMDAPAPSLSALSRHVMARPRLIPAMAPLSRLRGLLRRSFDDPRLRQLFGRYATYVGGAPHLSPAILSLIWHAEAQGVWTPEGGMHGLTQALGEVLRGCGVTIQTGAHVARLSQQSGRIAAVELEGGARLTCDAAIYAGDPRALATGTLGPAVSHVAPQTRTLPRSFSARVHSFAGTPGGFDLAFHNVLFAADQDEEFQSLARGQIPTDPTLYICALDRAEGTPPPLERFEIIANAPATAATDQPKELDAWHHRIMHRMTDRFGLTFSPTPSPHTITTPQDFARLFPASQGALYGQSPHGLLSSFQRPTARTKVPGLYLAGGGTHPGAGVPMAARSGLHAAEAILSDRTSTSPSARTAMRGGMSTA